MHERGRAAWYGSRVSFARALVLLAAVAAVVAGGSFLIRPAGHDDPPANEFLVVRASAEGNTSLTWDDVRAIRSQISSVDRAVPYLGKMAELTTGEASWNTRVVGTTPEYFDLMALHVAAGASFDPAASRSASKVVVLGDTVVAQLFGRDRSPVGEVVRIRSMPFTIIGVLAHQGIAPQGQDLDDVALVPIETYAAKIEITSRFDGAVLVSAKSPGDLAQVAEEVRALLRDRHRLAPGGDDDFVIRTSHPE